MYTTSVARQREAVNTWSWREELLDNLEASFSPERLDTYLAVAQGDRERALKLYTRNTELSAAFYGPLQGLEVALRNALHRELTRLYGAAWYDNLAAGLDRVALERIADAKRKIAPGPIRATRPRSRTKAWRPSSTRCGSCATASLITSRSLRDPYSKTTSVSWR